MISAENFDNIAAIPDNLDSSGDIFWVYEARHLLGYIKADVIARRGYVHDIRELLDSDKAFTFLKPWVGPATGMLGASIVALARVATRWPDINYAATGTRKG